MTEYIIAMTAFPGEEQAQALIQTVLERKLAACVQVLDMGSHYTWEEEICHEREVLILFKTRRSLYRELETQITMMHPYEVPEIIAVDIEAGAHSYLEWMHAVTKDPEAPTVQPGGLNGGQPVFSMSATEDLLRKLGSSLQEPKGQDYYTELYAKWDEEGE